MESLSIKVKPILQLNLLSDIEKLEDFTCELTSHKLLNQTKGNIYLQNCDFNEELKRTLTEAYTFIENATEASFIKSKTLNATAVGSTPQRWAERRFDIRERERERRSFLK